MAVALSNIRDLLLPGLQANVYEFSKLKEQWGAEVFNEGVISNQVTVNPEFTLEEINEAQTIIKAAGAGPNP